MKFVAYESITFKTSKGKVSINEGDTFKALDPESLKPLIDNGKVRPVVEVIDSERSKLKEFIAGFLITSNEIKESLPDVYSEIETLSETFKKYRDEENLSACIETLEGIKRLYMWAVAVLKPEAVSILLYSKTLECNVWVVLDDAEVQALRNKGIREPVYTHNEVKSLKGVSAAHLMQVNKVKGILGGAVTNTERIEG
ncbi:MAG: hypothetical protein H7844_07555 [Nitrospirae bacterium YQR-1]